MFSTLQTLCGTLRLRVSQSGMRLEARPSLLAAKAVLDSQQSGLMGLCRRAHQANLELAGAAA